MATKLKPSRINIADKPLSKGRSEVSLSVMSLLLAEMVKYSQDRVESLTDLELKLTQIGFRVGERILDVLVLRERPGKRDIQLVPDHNGVLRFIVNNVWKACFSKAADNLEGPHIDQDGIVSYMLHEKELVISKFISVPKEMEGLNCGGAFAAGIVEAVLAGHGFPPVKVTAHTTERGTTIVMKFTAEVANRGKGSAR